MTWGLIAFGAVWALATGFLSFAALVAGGYVAPFAVLILIVPYGFAAARWRNGAGRGGATLLGAVVALMLASSAALLLWERS